MVYIRRSNLSEILEVGMFKWNRKYIIKVRITKSEKGLNLMRNTIHVVESYIENGVMLPSFLLNDVTTYELIKNSGKYTVPTLSEFKEAIDFLSIEEECLYLTTNPFSPFVYSNELTYIDIASLNKMYLEIQGFESTIIKHIEGIENLREQGDYETIFTLTSTKYLLHVFHDIYDELPVGNKYKAFREVYTNMEYGFHAFKQEVLEEVLTLNMDDSFRGKLEVDNEGYITVFRGEGSKSSRIEEAHSWTTDENTAKFFANRFDKIGKIYQGKVRIENVIDFIEDRQESEILVLPENVEEVVYL